jgi:hypothetical protein
MLLFELVWEIQLPAREEVNPIQTSTCFDAPARRLRPTYGLGAEDNPSPYVVNPSTVDRRMATTSRRTNRFS